MWEITLEAIGLQDRILSILEVDTVNKQVGLFEGIKSWSRMFSVPELGELLESSNRQLFCRWISEL